MTACPKPAKRRKRARKPMPRSTKRIKVRGKRTRKSGGHLFPENVDEAYRAWLDVRSYPCLIAGRQRSDWKPGMEWTHVCFHKRRVKCHVKSRGSGGADKANIVLMCPRAHHEQGCIGVRAFERRYNANMRAAAEWLWAAYVAQQGEA